MARGEPLFRQWQLLKTLQANRFGLSGDDLAGRLGYSRRTVQRDLGVLQQVGFPISFEQRDFGKRFWKLTPQFIESEKLQLTVVEMLSLFLSQQLLSPLAGTPFGDGLASALQKIKAILPTRVLDYFVDLEDAFLIKSLGQEDYSGKGKEIAILNDAILHQRVLRIGLALPGRAAHGEHLRKTGNFFAGQTHLRRLRCIRTGQVPDDKGEVHGLGGH